MKVVAIIQARMGSSRLPGKVMKTLGGDTVLAQVVKRVRNCSLLDEIVVATTDGADDIAIVAEAERLGLASFRGSADDVLARYCGAAQMADADVVVRVTSDCPVFDGFLLQEMLAEFTARRESSQPCDYLSNSLERTYPRGLDAEIFSRAALDEAGARATERYEREHVTPYIYHHPEKFRLCHFKAGKDLSELRWTLDTPEDYRFLAEVFARLGRGGTLFGTTQVLALLDAHPELVEINRQIRQKELRD